MCANFVSRMLKEFAQSNKAINQKWVFFFVGSAPNSKSLFETPHHCSHFNMDERALFVGSSVYLNLLDEIIGA